MTNEEKIIYNLKRRKLRIFASIFVILILSVMLTLDLTFIKKVNTCLSEEKIKTWITDKPIESQIPEILSYFHNIESANVKFLFYVHFLAVGIGIFIGILIIDALIGRPKDRLLISMWDRIKELEKKSGI